MAYNSKVILCNNIKMDRDYKNVVDYTEEQMLNLCLSNKIAESMDFNFVRENGGQLNVPYSIDICLKANYMAFQNPDYSGKWFFAWIDEVHFVAPGTTKIIFTIDYWSTWFYKFNVGVCFIEREHVRDDIVGKHTIDEGLETGEYYINISDDDDIPNISTLAYVLSTTVEFTVDDSYKLVVDENSQTGGIYNGIYGGTNYFICGSGDISPMLEAINSIIKAGKPDTINGLFTFPQSLIRRTVEVAPNKGLYRVLDSDTAQGEIAKVKVQTNLNSYVPKNNKLLCYPYNYLAVDNSGGQSNIFRYEFFENKQDNEVVFNIRSALTPGGSIRMKPVNYNGDGGFVNGLNLAKFPICNWAVDMYTNWLTQNSVNIGGMNVSQDLMDTVNKGINALEQTATGNFSGAFNSIYSSMLSVKQHQLLPVVTRGNLNNGDVIASSKELGYHFYKMSIRYEYAQKIDEFFTRFGYKVNRLAKPYINIRPHWDYLKIGGSEDLGNGQMPQTAIETINNIARAGVTIWHNHDEIGDYGLDNSAPIS